MSSPNSTPPASPQASRRSSFQRLTARFTTRPKKPTTSEPPPKPEPSTVTVAVAVAVPDDPARAATLARLKQELMTLNDKERARRAEALADSIRVREAVERFRELAAAGMCAGVAVLGELEASDSV